MSELPAGWISTSLGALMNMKYGKGLKKSLRKGSGFPVYGSNGVVGEHNEAITDGPTIIVGRKGSIGEVHLSDQPCWPIDTTYFIDDLYGQPLRYWYYYLQSLPLAYLNKATAVPGISRSDAYKLKISLPPLNEQKRIAEKLDQILEEVNSAKDHLDQIPTILKNFRSSILAYASSGQLTQDWRKKNNVTLDSWEERLGQDIFPFITSGSRGWAKYYSEEGPLFLRVGNLNHQTIKLDLSNLQHVTPPQGAEGKRTRIELGDILISITADVGMVALISDDIGEAYINQHLCLARQSGEYNGQYLGYYLASPVGGLIQLTNKQRGVTKAGLTLGDIREVVIKIPCLEEQQEIVKRVEALMTLAYQIEGKYNAAKEYVNKITQSVLAKAFRGELAPQDPSDEPAFALLQRIKIEKEAAALKPKQKSRKIPRKTKEVITMISSILETLKKEQKPLTSQNLFEKSGYPVDSDPEKIEEFFLDIKSSLSEGTIIRERVNDEDIFKLAA